ncbi:hypothetical protein [Helicobacter burdigaliensis]|uniref:hypothetical protein n=1 Tax=Helicobacter burdigaliensis TaxID=2315334 RepID=UPI000EF70503|nr:hypothetical protein [Helicobacter burdigaliensis]
MYFLNLNTSSPKILRGGGHSSSLLTPSSTFYPYTHTNLTNKLLFKTKTNAINKYKLLVLFLLLQGVKQKHTREALSTSKVKYKSILLFCRVISIIASKYTIFAWHTSKAECKSEKNNQKF